MKVRISANVVIEMDDITSINLECSRINLTDKSGREHNAIYDNDLEAECIFNNLNSYLKVTDVRFHTEEKSLNVDDRKLKAFELFWSLYDKKVGRAAAEKSFRRLNLTEMGEAVKGVPKYVKSTPDSKYRKHPSTWINQKSWNDEIKSDTKEQTKYVKPKYVTDDR